MPQSETAPSTFGAVAEGLDALGYEPLPLAGKRPLYHDWQHYEQGRLSTLIYASGAANCGIATRGLAAIDCDVLDKGACAELRYALEKIVDQGKLLYRIGRAPKWLCLLRCAEGELPKRLSAEYEDEHGQRHRIEILRTGQQFLAFGPHPDTGKPMRWPHGTPLENATPADELPTLSEAQIDELFAAFDEIARRKGWTLTGRAAHAPADDAPIAAPVKGLTPDIARDVLRHYPNDELHYDEWLAVGMALHHQFQGTAEGFALWDAWSADAEKYGGEGYGWHRWQSFDENRPGGVSMRSVLMAAEDQGWVRPPGVEKAPACADEFPDLELPPASSLVGADTEPYAHAEPEVKDTGESFNKPETDAVDNPPSVIEKPKPHITFPGTFAFEPDFDPCLMPKRQWVIPGVLLAGHVSVLIGPPGSAKSALDLTRAISIATNRQLLNEPIAKPGPVLIVNNEDPQDEIERRVVSICNRHHIPLSELDDRLYLSSGYTAPIKFAELHGDRINGHSLRPTKDATRLLQFAQEKGLVAIIVDPLISTVRGGEENSNDRMEELASVFKRIASRTGCAVSITHHTRKTGRDSEAHAGDAEAARGGGALIGAVRMAYTLARMSAENGARRGLPRSVSKRLVRFDDAKSNYWMSDDEARWFFLESVEIGNGETAGVPIPVLLEDVQAEYGTPDDMSVEALTNDARRGVIVQLFAGDMVDGCWSGSLLRVAERWMAHADLKLRQAREQMKQLIPEGGFDHAVSVELHGVGYWLWREIDGEGNGARHTVHIAPAEEATAPGDEDDDGTASLASDDWME